ARVMSNATLAAAAPVSPARGSNTSAWLLGAAAVCLVAAINLKALIGTKHLDIRGSDTMLALGIGWSAAFMRHDPYTIVNVSGGGSAVGIEALIAGSVEIAESSRPVRKA